MNMEIHGYAYTSSEVRTVNDLRDLVRFLDDYRIDGDIEVEIDRGKAFVNIANGKAEMISCGDHVPPDENWDVIVLTHTHADDDPEPQVIPQYDWMSVDRYTTMWDGMPE